MYFLEKYRLGCYCYLPYVEPFESASPSISGDSAPGTVTLEARTHKRHQIILIYYKMRLLEKKLMKRETDVNCKRTVRIKTDVGVDSRETSGRGSVTRDKVTLPVGAILQIDPNLFKIVGI